MEELGRVVLILSAMTLFISWLLLTVTKGSRLGASPLPPGPRGLPIIGSLPFLKRDLPPYFTELSNVYGPIMKIRLGSRLCIVLGSSSAAKEVFRDHGITFANRDPPVVALAASHGGKDLMWAPYGLQWRMLRKVCAHQLMSNNSLEACLPLRRREVRKMVANIYAKTGEIINIGEQVYATIFNVIASMLWGNTVKGEEFTCTSVDFRHVLEEMAEIYGKPDVSDLFPILARFDIQGLAQRMKRLVLWVDRILDAIIDQRQREGSNKESKDFLQFLLQIVEQGDPKTPLTTTHIKALFMDLILAGTDTTWTTSEWAMAEMMHHPAVMRKAQEELEQVVGMNNTVEESHLPKLKYLDAVVKEVLRLHPVTPLMLPRSPSQSCTIGGYMVPKGTRIFINVWAVQRDPDSWENPLEFRPERFLEETGKHDYKGNDYRYIPFGSGRRLCVGLPIAERMLMYVLATFLHSFEWNLPEKTMLNLEGKFGIVLKKAEPLLGIPTPRLSNPVLYT
ncbi:hypothetical protein MRB53_003083 [Persea americana]|uniref:Uncharacterized protein n=1 Tax=Persea americana TaxID=3435 RepID=A0ACC2MX91_PERAE|nr:hypothetical protein MRB53_003083 [Persea americana]